MATLSLRSPRFGRLVKSEPRLLPHRGHLLEGALRDERVTRDEVLAGPRSSGVAHAAGVAAVALETGGLLNVIRGALPETGASTLDGLTGRRG